MDFNNIQLCGCAPTQIITFNLAINDASNIKIFDNCNNEYADSDLEFAYSVDGVCWSCYIGHNDLLINTIGLKTDFYLRIKVKGPISKVQNNGIDIVDYTTQLDSAFSFTYCDNTTSSNIYNPYAGMDCAIKLQKHMADMVCCMFGIPVYYFRLNPNQGSKDITFKEYTLMNVEPPKQIKLMIQDNMMPSSKPEFNDFGLDFQTDWETEIGKTMFYTSFGQNAQPMEGDFIWIPMMKRMWQVTGAYEEKKDALMWNATTFKVSLVKYEEKGSIDLGDMEDMVNSFIVNKYDDLFGEDNEDNAGTELDSVNMPSAAANNLYPIYKSDATRKYITCEGVEIQDVSTYFKGTVISDACYVYSQYDMNKQIIYQKQYCGNDISLCFIITPKMAAYSGNLISIGSLNIDIKQHGLYTDITVNKDSKLTVTIEAGNTYFIYLRWSKDLNIAELGSILYTYNQSIPQYKLQDNHYYYDVDNATRVTTTWNIEFAIDKKTDIILRSVLGTITNIKVFDIYNDNISEMLQMYPTNNNLLVNDTARKLVGLDGVKIR